MKLLPQTEIHCSSSYVLREGIFSLPENVISLIFQLLQCYYHNISRKTIHMQNIPWYHQRVWFFWLGYIKPRGSNYKYQFRSKKKLFPHHSPPRVCNIILCLILAALLYCGGCWKFSVAKWEEFSEHVGEKACLDLSRLSLRKRTYEKYRLHLALC